MKLRLSLLTWLAGLPGVVSFAWLAYPALVSGITLPVPLWVAQLASAAQGSLLLGAAAFAGAALAQRVSLESPVLAAVARGAPMLPPLLRQVVPGAVGGAIGAVILWIASGLVPDALAEAQARHALPATVRLLYGGITEEVLLRWGLMTTLVWLFWRLVQRGQGTPSAAVLHVAIVVSAVMFGLGHLPAVAAMAGTVSPALAIYVVTANAAFGMVAGWLFARFGLEAAMLAHVLAHAIVLALPG